MIASRLVRLLALSAITIGATACGVWSWESSVPNPRYCDDATPCVDPALPVCDLLAKACVLPGDAGPTCRGAADCTEAAPVCDAGGKCRPCAGPTDDDACKSRTPLAPRCAPTGGACVTCRADTQSIDCADPKSPVCDAGACRPCRAHADCASGACLPDGRCAPSGMVAFVDNGGVTPATCKSAGSHDGTRGHPHCDVEDALGAKPPLPFVVVAGSAAGYGPIAALAGTVTVLGPGVSAKPTARIEGDKMVDAVQVAVNGAVLELVGLEVANASSGGNGIHCVPANGSATVTIRRSSIHNNDGGGVSASSCTITLDASLVTSNAGGGVSLTKSMYTITNDIIAANGASGPGVVLDSPSMGTFAFNTVVQNKSIATLGGIDCGGGLPKQIASSIVVGNDKDAVTGSQLGPKCVLAQVVTGTDTATGAVQLSPVFVDPMRDFHLKANDPANAGPMGCCVDQVASPNTPNADHDVDGNHRPRGAAWDIGGHEVQ